MSNISRRDFMKTAGVMTLAVAASGVLAGCSTADTSDEVVKTSATSATVGDYEISIKDVKRFATSTAVKAGDNTFAAKTAQYVVVLVNVKNTKSDEAKAEASAEITPKATNVESGSVTAINAAGVKKQFDLKVEPKDASATPIAFATAITNTTADGTPYYYAYEVSAYDDDTFKTPTFKITVNDKDKKVYTTLEATIPATATTVKTSDIKK